MEFFESISGVPGRASAVNRRRGWRRFLDDRDILLFRLSSTLRDRVSSHEHRRLSSGKVGRPLRGRCLISSGGALDPPCSTLHRWYDSRASRNLEGWSSG